MLYEFIYELKLISTLFIFSSTVYRISQNWEVKEKIGPFIWTSLA